MGIGIQDLNPLDDPRGNAGRRVHRQIERHQLSGANCLLVQALHGEVDAGYPSPSLSKPGGWGGESEGLPPQFICGYQHGLHQGFFLMLSREG